MQLSNETLKNIFLIYPFKNWANLGLRANKKTECQKNRFSIDTDIILTTFTRQQCFF